MLKTALRARQRSDFSGSTSENKCKERDRKKMLELMKIKFDLGGYAVERNEVTREKILNRTRAHRAHGSQASR